MATKRVQPTVDPTATATTDAEFEQSAKPKTRTRKAAAPKSPPKPKAEPKAPKAKVVKEKAPVEVDGDGNPIKKTRTVRGTRNHLARDIDGVLRAAGGPVSVKDIVAGITYDDGSHPSSGAVAAALIRWSSAVDGDPVYIEVNEKPLGFKKFVAKFAKSDLDTYLAAARDARIARRRAAREAASA